MSLLSRLFGGGSSSASKPQADPVAHEDFRIYPEPAKESGGFRIVARIEKDIDGETKTHQMIRADVCNSADEAEEASIAKARQLIDQQGDKIFG